MGRMVGDVVSIRVDANQGYTADVAVPLFSELDLLLVEQPVIKLMKAGGLHPSSRIASTAAAQYPLAIGSMLELGVGTAAGAQFAAAQPHVRYPCDVKGPSLYAESLLADPVRIEDGYTHVPDGPGLGVALDPEAVEKYRDDR